MACPPNSLTQALRRPKFHSTQSLEIPARALQQRPLLGDDVARPEEAVAGPGHREGDEPDVALSTQAEGHKNSREIHLTFLSHVCSAQRACIIHDVPASGLDDSVSTSTPSSHGSTSLQFLYLSNYVEGCVVETIQHVRRTATRMSVELEHWMPTTGIPHTAALVIHSSVLCFRQ
ncbi:hypothetical protein BKA70DRAFT_1444472 [Coprinopsis sp. MPI-PUGE-AT-0042]|nr:hypothetical protein BKA70DRAFT_1444472 [Coprinopsis sp. MPI-PUGE-AT-0042]